MRCVTNENKRQSNESRRTLNEMFLQFHQFVALLTAIFTIHRRWRMPIVATDCVLAQVIAPWMKFHSQVQNSNFKCITRETGVWTLKMLIKGDAESFDLPLEVSHSSQSTSFAFPSRSKLFPGMAWGFAALSSTKERNVAIVESQLDEEGGKIVEEARENKD